MSDKKIKKGYSQTLIFMLKFSCSCEYLPYEQLIYAFVAQLDRVFGYEPKGQGFESLRAHHFEKWLNLVEHLVWDQGVAGSNPVFPTI